MKDQPTMAHLAVGESGMVTAVGGQFAIQQRFHDLGLIPGTTVTCVTKSPAGDPGAYLIRGSVIALRRGDAQVITLEQQEDADG